LRQSEIAQDHSILLPIYAQMTDDDMVRIAGALRSELDDSRSARPSMAINR
jgi:hypothetical protein